MNQIPLYLMFLAIGIWIGGNLSDKQHEETMHALQNPTYTQRQQSAYDFMRDNPKSRQEVCSKRFNPVMDSDGGKK